MAASRLAFKLLRVGTIGLVCVLGAIAALIAITVAIGLSSQPGGDLGPRSLALLKLDDLRGSARLQPPPAASKPSPEAKGRTGMADKTTTATVELIEVSKQTNKRAQQTAIEVNRRFLQYCGDFDRFLAERNRLDLATEYRRLGELNSDWGWMGAAADARELTMDRNRFDQTMNVLLEELEKADIEWLIRSSDSMGVLDICVNGGRGAKLDWGTQVAYLNRCNKALIPIAAAYRCRRSFYSIGPGFHFPWGEQGGRHW